ncbi:polysaccharide deacetylase family protein [Marinilongibacter aquaticus]|uniref:polysaccharide deacetylase family protein n=1 Tax=Marinilongibacter aquaticus TaxID=2975157 RepID=UPI0021BD9B2E|nr:polysaccharide deacetylase family protein [Marinilongibacter aquaticus]UBM58998.1 polysaccharide deacetylase family protein [Marinilongibacter aquaticus]
MFKTLGLITSILLFAGSLFAQKKYMVITVDDLPTVPYGLDDDLEITRKLVSHFKKYDIPAIGFVNESKLYEEGTLSPAKTELLEMWLDGGLELGNHTFSHMDYHKNSFDSFAKEVEKGEQITPKLSESRAMPWRYFRHPYLHIGENKEKADSLKTFLLSENYIEAPVTIDNADYLFALAYARAKRAGDAAKMRKIGSDYVKYMEAETQYHERLSELLFERQISQILLTHASLLNADYYDELAQMFQRNGYEFTTLEHALDDKAYTSQITAYGRYGISWLQLWLLSSDLDRDILKEEPQVPAYITE